MGIRPRTRRAIRLRAFRCPRCSAVIGRVRPRCSKCGMKLPKFR